MSHLLQALGRGCRIQASMVMGGRTDAEPFESATLGRLIGVWRQRWAMIQLQPHWPRRCLRTHPTKVVCLLTLGWDKQLAICQPPPWTQPP
jgi:hypothetical protein